MMGWMAPLRHQCAKDSGGGANERYGTRPATKQLSRND
jgi:hypothetical protein